MDMLLREAVKAAEIAMPGADPALQRAEALKLLRRGSKGITMTTAAGDTINIGGDGEAPMDLTNANQTKVQGDEIAYRKFNGTLGMAKDLITKNPQSVGLVGQARGTAQDVATAAQGFGQLFGIQDIGGELAAAQQEAAAFGVDPSILNFEYDPSVSQIESVMNILAYQGARAIGGQSGNDLSDKDIKHIKDMLGDPTSMFMNQGKLLGKLDLVQRYIDGQRAINDQIRGVQRPAATTPNGNIPAPAAPNTGAAIPSGTTSKGTGWKVVQ